MGSDIDKLTISCPIHISNINANGCPTDRSSDLTQSVDGCPLMDTVPADARVSATSV